LDLTTVYQLTDTERLISDCCDGWSDLFRPDT